MAGMRGYFGIGVFNLKNGVNLGTLWRSAYQLGAAFIFTVGQRYKKQSSDTPCTWRHIPLHAYLTFEEFAASAPLDAKWVGIEMGGAELSSFAHPERAIYILGAEDSGLPQAIIDRCYACVSIPAIRVESYNVSVAGSIVMYDRLVKAMRSVASATKGVV